MYKKKPFNDTNYNLIVDKYNFYCFDKRFR